MVKCHRKLSKTINMNQSHRIITNQHLWHL